MHLKHVLYKDHGLPVLRESNSNTKEAANSPREEDLLRQYSSTHSTRILGYVECVHQWSRRHGSRGPLLDPSKSRDEGGLHCQVQRQEGSCHQKRGGLGAHQLRQG